MSAESNSRTANNQDAKEGFMESIIEHFRSAHKTGISARAEILNPMIGNFCIKIWA